MNPSDSCRIFGLQGLCQTGKPPNVVPPLSRASGTTTPFPLLAANVTHSPPHPPTPLTAGATGRGGTSVCGRARLRGSLVGVLFLLVVGLTATELRADLVRLRSGGEVRGIIRSKPRQSPNEPLTIETLHGTLITIEGEEIDFITLRPQAVEEYESRTRDLPDTAEAHWDLAEWCKHHRLVEQRKPHLERTIELDPDHARARGALGHVFRNGEWVDQEADMLARGYVKYKGKFITVQEMELHEKSAEDLQHEREWFPKIRLWQTWLLSNHLDRRQQALQQLERVNDPYAVTAITRFFVDDQRPELRQLGARVLVNVHHARTMKPLVRLALYDPIEDVRDTATTGLTTDFAESVQPLLFKELKNAKNSIVRRAASILGTVGDEQAIIPLIDALVTTHYYKVSVPAPTIGFTADGQMANSGTIGLPADIEAGLRTGQYPAGVIVINPDLVSNQARRVINYRYDHQNPEALTALQELTGADHGYDERTWRLWWAAEKSAGRGLKKRTAEAESNQ